MKSSLNVALIGNKKDLDEIRQVPTAEANEFAEVFNWQYYEVSAAEPDLSVFDSIQSAVSELSLFRKNLLASRSSSDKGKSAVSRRRSSIQQLYHAVEQKIKNIRSKSTEASA